MDLSQVAHIDAKKIASKTIEGEVVVIDLSNGTYFSLDSLGGFYWNAALSRHSLDSVCKAICEMYELSTDQVEADIVNFTNALIENNLVSLSAENISSETLNPQKPDGTAEYAAPELNRYDDMKDLLALDPPLPGLEDITTSEE